MHIILDTCIIRKDLKLTSYSFQTLIEFCRQTNSTLVIPEIVMDEILAIYRRELQLHEAKISNEIQLINQFLLQKIIFKPILDIESEVKKIQENFKEKFSSVFFSSPKYKDSYLREILKRNFEQKKPFSNKDQGFRDTILWLTIKDYIKENDDYAFISNNIKDFADGNNNRLHPTLNEEILKCDKNLTYFRSLEEFNTSFSSKTDFITEAWINTMLDWEKAESLYRKEIGDTINFSAYAYLYNYKNSFPHDFNYHKVEVVDFERRIYNHDIQYNYLNNEIKAYFMLYGNLHITFFTENDKIKIEIQASTSYDIKILENKIVYIREHLYEEESMLHWDDDLFVEFSLTS